MNKPKFKVGDVIFYKHRNNVLIAKIETIDRLYYKYNTIYSKCFVGDEMFAVTSTVEKKAKKIKENQIEVIKLLYT